jgi:hypothetical protein
MNTKLARIQCTLRHSPETRILLCPTVIMALARPRFRVALSHVSTTLWIPTRELSVPLRPLTRDSICKDNQRMFSLYTSRV